MNSNEFFCLCVPLILSFCWLTEVAVLKLVGRRCASWYTIGYTLGFALTGMVLIFAGNFM